MNGLCCVYARCLAVNRHVSLVVRQHLLSLCPKFGPFVQTRCSEMTVVSHTSSSSSLKHWIACAYARTEKAIHQRNDIKTSTQSVIIPVAYSWGYQLDTHRAQMNKKRSVSAWNDSFNCRFDLILLWFNWFVAPFMRTKIASNKLLRWSARHAIGLLMKSISFHNLLAFMATRFWSKRQGNNFRCVWRRACHLCPSLFNMQRVTAAEKKQSNSISIARKKHIANDKIPICENNMSRTHISLPFLPSECESLSIYCENRCATQNAKLCTANGR